MRRKNQLISRQINPIKNMHDKKLSFIFLLHLVNYKKFKSIKKRLLLINFSIFRNLLSNLKLGLYNAHRKMWFSKNSISNKVLIPSFFLKRMFGKKNNVLSELDDANIKYIFKNGHFNKVYFKNKNILEGADNYFSGLELSSTPKELLETSLVVKKGLGLESCELQFNTSMMFNLSLLNAVEMYSCLTLLWILKSKN